MAIGIDRLSFLGIVGLLIAHPFDTGVFGCGFRSAMALPDCFTVKVRLQNPDLSSRYHSVSHAFTTIIREERFSGLYKGIASPLVLFSHKCYDPNLLGK